MTSLSDTRSRCPRRSTVPDVPVTPGSTHREEAPISELPSWSGASRRRSVPIPSPRAAGGRSRPFHHRWTADADPARCPASPGAASPGARPAPDGGSATTAERGGRPLETAASAGWYRAPPDCRRPRQRIPSAPESLQTRARGHWSKTELARGATACCPVPTPLRQMQTRRSHVSPSLPCTCRPAGRYIVLQGRAGPSAPRQ